MEGKRFLRSIELKNILSYGPEGVKLELEPLNVLIGPNASGKSNLIQALRLLQAAPNDFSKPIREGGGVDEWIWKGTGRSGRAHLKIQTVDPLDEGPGIEYALGFTSESSRFLLEQEEIRGRNLESIYRFRQALLPRKEPTGFGILALEPAEFSVRRDLSILAQLRDPRQSRLELDYLTNMFPQIAFFQRSWLDENVRRPQPADLPNDFLLESGLNLGLVLSGLLNRTGFRRRLIEKVQLLYPQIEDVAMKVEGGTVQVFLHEAGLSAPTPSARISDGTFRYLCLLSILLQPEPPPLVCIEEPELGLHPDAVSSLGALLIEASQRTQLIVTTHSDALVASLSEVPEAIVVTERGDQGTTLRRLDPSKLGAWLEDYRLGDLWRMGELGGNRW